MVDSGFVDSKVFKVFFVIIILVCFDYELFVFIFYFAFL